MSGISSKIGSVAFGVQSAKGVVANAPLVKFFLAGDPSLAPVKNRGRYNMTDASQDNGPAYTSLMAVEGGLSMYAHPDGVALLSALVSGSNVDSGVSAPYTHVASPADDMLWVTIWREVGGVIIEQFVDCKVHNMQVEGSAGQPLTIALDVIGCTSTYQESNAPLAALAALDSHGYLYPEAATRIKIDGVAKRIHKISFGISRNASGYQADGYNYADVDPGAREVTLSFSTRFGSGAIGEDEYREFYYGSAAGTAQDAAVATKSFEVEFLRDANHSWTIEIPAVTYAAVPVNPGTSGDPIEVEVACEVERPDTGDIYTITTTDERAEALA